MHKVLTTAALLALPLPAAPQALDPGSVVSVRLERSACFGTCPVYSLLVSRDGTLAWRGVAHVDARGERTGKVAADEFALIAAAAAHVRFLALRDHYAAKSDGCTELWTDHGSIRITLQSTGGTKSVQYYLGCKGPAELRRIAWLADTIDEMTSSAQWIGAR